MGSVINLPLLVNKELYLLRLEPLNRTGCFVFYYSANRRCIFTINERENLDYFYVQAFMLGGNLEVFEEDHGMDAKILAQASRITREQYKVWDQLRLMNRVQLQIEWAKDAVKRAENDLIKALEMPDDDPEKNSRWDTFALTALIDRISQASAELDGLYLALSAF